MGEEFGETRKSSSFRWIIDPIDGTQSFILRTPLFGTLLALERDGVPILGSIYLPIQDQLMIGSPQTGTFFEGEECFVSHTAVLGNATLLISNPADVVSKEYGSGMTDLYRSVRLVRSFGDCYGYYLVARGIADIMVDLSEIEYYDVAPMLPILAGSGGMHSTVEGFTDFRTPTSLASNGLLHNDVRRILTDPLL